MAAADQCGCCCLFSWLLISLVSALCFFVGDLWHGMMSRKSHAGKLKNWMPRHSKKPSVGVELRAGGDPHRSEKPGWSAGDMRQ